MFDSGLKRHRRLCVDPRGCGPGAVHPPAGPPRPLLGRGHTRRARWRRGAGGPIHGGPVIRAWRAGGFEALKPRPRALSLKVCERRRNSLARRCRYSPPGSWVECLLDRPSRLSGTWAEEIVECSGECIGRRPSEVIGDDDDVLAAPESDGPHPLHRPAVGADVGVVDLDEDLGPRVVRPTGWRAVHRRAARSCAARHEVDAARSGTIDRRSGHRRPPEPSTTAISSQAATASSQPGHVPPRPTRRMKTPQSSHRWSPSDLVPQASHS